MLELIFQGFIEWIYGMILEMWEFFGTALLDIVNMDLNYLRNHIPIVDSIAGIMLAVGWALLLGNLVFQAIRTMMTGLGFEGEDPTLLFTRTFVFSFLLLASPQICEIGLDMATSVIDIIGVTDAVEITFPDDSSFAGLGAAWILVIITGVIIMFKVLGLLFDIAERYIILAMLTICAPLAFGVGGSRSTSDIFTGWCRMFGSMCFVMVSHVIFFKMLLSVLSYVPSGIDVLPWMVLVFGIVKVARKIDSIVTRIGLNPAITGDSLGRGLPGMLTYAIVRSVGQNVTKTLGKSAPSRGGASSPPPPGAGSPKTPPPSGGSPNFGATAGGGRSNTHQSSNSSSNTSTTSNTGTTAHGGTQNTSTSQQSTNGQNSTQNQSSATTMGGTVRQEQSGRSDQGSATRQSAVPPGTRRSPTHVVGNAGTSKSGQGTSGMRSGMARSVTGSNNMQSTNKSGDASHGMAGTQAATHSATTQSGKSGNSQNGTAGTRFTAVQNVRQGNVNSDMHATEENNVSSGTVVQGRTTTTVPQGKMQAASADIGSQNRADSTRHSSRPTDTARSGNVPSPHTPHTAPSRETRQTSSANSTTNTVRSSVGSSERHGRNGSTSVSAQSSIGGAQQTARQEQPHSQARQSAPSKASAPRMQSGTAGTTTQNERVPQAQKTTQKQSGQAQSVGRPSQGRKVSSTGAATQEKGVPDARRSTRKPNEGDTNGS